MTRRSLEAGFTLVEMLMVIIIIGLLASIAVPTYVRARNQSYDSQAKAALTTAFKVARAYYIDHDFVYNVMAADNVTYVSAIWDSAPNLPGEPGYTLLPWDTPTYELAASTTSNPKNIMLWSAEAKGQVLILCNQSKSGNSFCIADIRTQPVDYGNTPGWGSWTPGVYYGKSHSVTYCGNTANSMGNAWGDIWCDRKTKW